MSLKHQKYYFWPPVLKVLISLLLIFYKAYNNALCIYVNDTWGIPVRI